MNKINKQQRNNPISTVFVVKADRWLSDLTLYLSTHVRKLSSIEVGNLPESIRLHLYKDCAIFAEDNSPIAVIPQLDPYSICQVAEYCLLIIASTHSIQDPPLTVKLLDDVSLALMTGEGLGLILEQWDNICREAIKRSIN